MNRRELLHRTAAFGVMIATAPSLTEAASEPGPVPNPLQPPAEGSIPVAFLISDGAVVIDFTGPWEVFQDVSISTRSEAPFRLYTVAEAQKPIRASGGMKILPDYTILNAPAPKVLV